MFIVALDSSWAWIKIMKLTPEQENDFQNAWRDWSLYSCDEEFLQEEFDVDTNNSNWHSYYWDSFKIETVNCSIEDLLNYNK